MNVNMGWLAWAPLLAPALFASAQTTPAPHGDHPYPPGAGAASAFTAAAAAHMYGRVVTAAGETYVGFIRWDGVEGAWADALGGAKALPAENFEQVRRLRAELDPEADRALRMIEFMGVRITWDIDDTEDVVDSARSGIRFGHLRSLFPIGPQAVRLVLKSGLEVELSVPSGASTDFARGVVVDTPGGAETAVAWRELVSLELLSPPPDAAPRAVRLHGTVGDRRGNRYTGYLTWSAAAAYTFDRVEGREGGRERQVPFERIALIERAAANARLTLTTGETLTLAAAAARGAVTPWDAISAPGTTRRGEATGPVAVGAVPGGGGVQVSDITLGQVRLPWSEVEQVRFHAPEAAAAEAGLEIGMVGGRLRGTVVTQSGERHTGVLRWDNDEEYAWEVLNGVAQRISFAVELANVLEIRRRTQRSSLVTLRDGRSLELSGSNDVGWGNKGVVLEADDGTFHLIDWVSFRSVTFERP